KFKAGTRVFLKFSLFEGEKPIEVAAEIMRFHDKKRGPGRKRPVTTGVGLKLVDNQLPELMGFDYKVAELAQMMHRPAWLHEVSWIAVLSGLGVAFLVVVAKPYKRFPAALIGVAAVTALSAYVGWDVQRVGQIPHSLPLPGLPNLADDKWLDLLWAALPLGLIAAVESLTGSSALPGFMSMYGPCRVMESPLDPKDSLIRSRSNGSASSMKKPSM
ncbi:MAG: SulP family inorganic anion transporter, partial [Deltaproteobacteria bacterium]|nr:SulP family inorganic anion transporter [Deltaproteobacteria bacterium]